MTSSIRICSNILKWRVSFRHGDSTLPGSALDFPPIDSGDGEDMALSSMTGFAQSSGEKDGLHWQWEIKSVNGKALDIRCRLPSGFEALEAVARTTLAQHIKRGNLQVTLSTSGAATPEAVVVNEAVLEQVLTIAEKLRDRIGGVPLSAYPSWAFARVGCSAAHAN
jgi:hypothetical protein